MYTTEQMLGKYPLPLLEVIAELRNAFLEGAESPEQATELLAAQITDPASVQSAYEEVADESLAAQEAIEALLHNGGEMTASQFERKFGEVRQMGAAKLEREAPWLEPTGVAERLYYLGLIGTGFSGEGSAAKSIIFVPSDVIPWLPAPQQPAHEGGLDVRPVAPPQASRILAADDSFLEDAGSLIGFLHTDTLRLTKDGEAHPDDRLRFARRLQLPVAHLQDAPGADHVGPENATTESGGRPGVNATPDAEVRLDLLLHIAKRLGWLRLGTSGDDRVVELTGNRVREFLDAPRAEQRRLFWDAWRQSPEWNDLFRTPEFTCTHRENWSNDPLQTRKAVLSLLARLEPGAWYSRSEVIQAIQDTEPDFQRPTGEYETWYIRSNITQEYLKGFEQWDAVEGALLRFYLRGPLHWLQVMDVTEPEAGDGGQMSLSQWGAHWLTEDAPLPHEATPQPLEAGEDFTVRVPFGTPLADRFRVERFAVWQRSEPDYLYQINQRSLQRAREDSISAARVLEFLQAKAVTLPDNVERALRGFA